MSSGSIASTITETTDTSASVRVEPMAQPDRPRTTCGDSGGRTKGGDPCGWSNNLSPETGLCATHDPSRREEALAIRQAGGKVGRRAAARAALQAQSDDVPPIPKTLDDATRYFAWIVNAIATGRLDARAGHEAAYALNGFKAAAEKRDLERQIKQLRKELAEAKRPRGRA